MQKYADLAGVSKRSPVKLHTLQDALDCVCWHLRGQGTFA